MKKTLPIIIFFLFVYLPLLAQEVPLDVSFHYMDRAAGSGFNRPIKVVFPQDDGKQLVGGQFTTYNGIPASGLIRLLFDGQKDSSFHTGTGFQTSGEQFASVNAIQIQRDGKLLIGGDFTSYKGSEVDRFVRLNPDGTRDASFQTGVGFDGAVNVLLLQSDDKILVGGRFSTYRGQPVPSLIRIDPDGSRDTSFNPQDVSDEVHDFTFQKDGRILVNFGNKLIRLYPDGSKDETFQLAEPYGTTVIDSDHPEDGEIMYTFNVQIYPQEDGKILLKGYMRASRRSVDSFLRLLPDGTLDGSFEKHVLDSDRRFVSLTKNNEGELFRINELYEISRLRPDGSEEEFLPLHSASSAEWSISPEILEVQKDGKFLVSGNWKSNNGLLRFNEDGSLDETYNPQPEFNGQVSALTLQNSGKIIVGGTFTSYNGEYVNTLARIFPDGTLDGTFNAGMGLDIFNFIPRLSILNQPDERILVVGSFNTFNGKNVGGIVRLNPNGSMDDSFHVGTGFKFPSNLQAILQNERKIIVSTPFTNEFDGDAFHSLIRLNLDGSKDTSFDIGSGFDWSVMSISPAPDNKILVGGDFSIFNGNPVNRLVRLNPDGSLDASFKASDKLDISIKSIHVLADGKILAVASDGPTALKSRLIRFNQDGSLDVEFKSEIPAIYSIGAITIQPDKKILISSGEFERYLVRMLPDGRIDPTLKLVNKFNGGVETMVVNSEDNLLVGGEFTSLNGKTANRIAQIQNISEQPAPLEDVIRINAGGPSLRFGSEEWMADTYFIEGSTYTNEIPIANTENDALYQTERYGDISYEIPVPQPGIYALELHFAEIHWDRSGARIFDLYIENNIFRSNIDLANDIGINTANVLRIENLKVDDGSLSLEFLSRKDRAKISGIALFKQGITEVPETIRINAGGDALYYADEEWLADRYYLGGKTYVDDSKSISNTTREKIYHSERYGKFKYQIPVPRAGKYVLGLYFAEIFWEAENQRIFDVLVENGQHKLENLDLVKAIGEPNRAFLEFSESTSVVIEVMDGVLDLEFIPRVNEAKLSGLSLTSVDPNPWGPVLSDPKDFILDQGQEWSFQIDALSHTPGYTLTYFAVGLPEGVTLDPISGIISGRFSSVGRNEIALKVTDNEGNSAYSDFTVTVNPLNVVARINSGGGALKFGEEEWQADRYYSGGRSYTTKASISNTGKEALYQSERNGNFSYKIPVPQKGAYTVELHFAEIHWNRENARLFRFRLENASPMEIIDLYKNHGGANNAYILQISDVQVVDGILNLDLITEKDRAKLSGIAVYQQSQTYPSVGQVQLRINAGGPSVVFNGEEWMADTYFNGGRTFGLAAVEIGNTDNDEVYQSERYGNFNYSLPTPEEGLYTVEMHFAEIHWNKSGARVFGLEIENGQFAMDNIDLYGDYGGKNSAYMVRAENISVSDGNLDLTFNSDVNNAKLSGITLYKQSKTAPNGRIAQETPFQMVQELEDRDSIVESTGISIFPNPARDMLNLEFSSEVNGVWNLVLINSLGVASYTERLNLEKGIHRLEIDLSAYRLSAGTYYLQLMSDVAVPRVLRVIIQ